VTPMDQKLKAMHDQRNPTTKRLGDGLATGLGWLVRKPRFAWAMYPHWSVREQWCALALFTFGAALMCMLLFDVRAALYARGLPQFLVAFFREITDFGKSGWTLWPSAILLLACLFVGASAVFTRMQRQVLAAIAVRAEFVFVAIAAPGLFTTIVKRIVGRGRPLAAEQHLHHNIPDAFYYTPFTTMGDFTAMPSGHATAAFSALVVFGSLWPKARPYLWVYAIAIALSRVILLSHFVSDVVVGALVGALGAIMIRNAFAARGLVFYRDDFGHVVPKAGPSWARIKALAGAVRGQ
jgi:membrane-associated phospholipid phosphatase